jgi:hypothetical protein
MGLGKELIEAVKDGEGMRISDSKAELTELQTLIAKLKGRHKDMDKWKLEATKLHAEMVKAETSVVDSLKTIETKRKSGEDALPAISDEFNTQMKKVTTEGAKYLTKLKERVKAQKTLVDQLNKLTTAVKASD